MLYAQKIVTDLITLIGFRFSFLKLTTQCLCFVASDVVRPLNPLYLYPTSIRVRSDFLGNFSARDSEHVYVIYAST